MNKIIKGLIYKALLTGISILIICCTCFAESAHEVYVVDVQKIIAESIVGKAAQNNLEGEVKKSESKLIAQRQELERLKQDLGKQKALLSKEAIEQKVDTLQKKERELQLLVAEEQDKMKRKNGDEIQKVVAKIQKIIAELAEQKDVPLIVEKSPRWIVYVDPKFDLTVEAIKLLDEAEVS